MKKDGDDDGGVGGDVAGAEKSPHVVQRVRVSKTLQYYGDPSNFEELAVLTISLGPCDEKVAIPVYGRRVEARAASASFGRALDPQISVPGNFESRRI